MGCAELASAAVCVDVVITWQTVSILWYLLDGLIFIAAISAYGIAMAEKRGARERSIAETNRKGKV